jgi:serine/threonine protein kinase
MDPKRVIGKYVLGRTIGRGSFAKVKLARDTETNSLVAIKVLEKEMIARHHTTVKQVKSEISTMKLVRHPYIVQLREVVATKKRIFIVMEYVKGGELYDRINRNGRLLEDEARKYFHQLIDAVDYCHSRNVYHRDLKPENLLLDDQNNLKISDFGLSALPQQFGRDGLLHTTCGTPNYIAPEVIRNKGYHGSPADLWSCGVILFVLMAGYLPFDDTHQPALYKKIMRSDFTFPSWFSTDAQNFITRILDPNPKTRMTAAQIYQDAWFKKDYKPAKFDECEDVQDVHDRDDDVDENIFSAHTEVSTHHVAMNAFELINHLQGENFNLSPLFETKEDTVFKSTKPCKDIVSAIESAAKPLGFHVRTHDDHMMKLEGEKVGRKGHLSIATEIIQVAPCIHMVELQKNSGDTLEYRTFCNDLVGKGLKDIVFQPSVNARKRILPKK